MGNCIRHESPMQWGGDDWEDELFSAPERGGDATVAPDADETEELLEKSRRYRSSNEATSGAVAVVADRKEVKIRITKRQLEELLGRPDMKKEKPVEQLVSQLMAMSASDRFETGQRSWRPALKSIPEIIWYPLFGQLYVLANNLRIDRSNPTADIESMREAADAVVKKYLSLIIFPEGTRSKNGRLLPFKKGFVHFALQSRRPVVPIVLSGTHLAWRKGGLRVRPAPLAVKFLSPIKTDEWTADHIDEYVGMIHEMYVKHLPESQRPLASNAATWNDSVS